MPLSEHEQRLLDEMERNLYQNDADFVASVGGPRRRPGYRAIVLGLLVAIVGIGVLVTGVVTKISIVGIVGFVLMFAGVLLAVTPRRKGAAEAEPGRPRAQSPFMDRMSDRWDRRNGADS